jgi:hypothetical protein
VFARRLGAQTHFVVTRHLMVMTLTTDRHVAEFSEGVTYRCACVALPGRCSNRVAVDDFVCVLCQQGDHSGHK